MNKKQKTKEARLLRTGLIRKALIGDIEYVASHMRKEDRASLEVSSNRTASEALTYMAFTCPHTCYTALSPQGEPIGIFGIFPQKKSLQGTIFALFTDEAAPHSELVLKLAPRVFDFFHSIRPLLVNSVDERNTIHIKWLKALGVTFYGTTTLADPSVVFYQFAKVQ